MTRDEKIRALWAQRIPDEICLDTNKAAQVSNIVLGGAYVVCLLQIPGLAFHHPGEARWLARELLIAADIAGHKALYDEESLLE